MRDVFVNEIEADDLDVYVKRYLAGGEIRCEKSAGAGDSVIYDIETDGLRQRIAFTQV